MSKRASTRVRVLLILVHPKQIWKVRLKTVPFSRRLFLEAARPEPSSLEEYTACVENKNSLVVSEVFCLPHDYRKDVPPPSEYGVDLYEVKSQVRFTSMHSSQTRYNSTPEQSFYLIYIAKGACPCSGLLTAYVIKQV